MKWGIIVALTMLLVCALTLGIFLLGATPEDSVLTPTEATGKLPKAFVTETSITEEHTEPPTEPLPEVDPFQGLTPIGTYYATPDAIAPEILKDLQAGGLVFHYEAELPDAPQSLPGYRYAPITLDQDALLRFLFGEDYTFVPKEHIGGVNGELTTDTGTYYVLLSNGTRLYTTREDGAAYRGRDELDTLHTELSDLLGITLELWRTGYACGSDAVRTDYAQMLGGVPVSDHTYYIGKDEATGHGSQLCVSYDDDGLKKLILDYLTEVVPTGEPCTALLSAEDALQLVQARMSGASVNAVQVFKSCRLVYLNPPEAEDEMIPAWELRYDFYELDPARELVSVCAGEYAYLVNAVDGTLYSYH